jgi:hypothetical protein
MVSSIGVLIVLVLILLLLGALAALLRVLILGLLQLVFPEVICRVSVETGEDDIEDFAIPVNGVALNAFFDILRRTVSNRKRNRARYVYSLQAILPSHPDSPVGI